MTNKTMPILPVEAYTSQEFFDLEQREIFSKTWQFAGLIEDLAKPGDTLSVQVGPMNLLVVLGQYGQLSAVHNLCRHRGSQLLRTVGSKKKVLQCPYHDWTYSLDGELIGVPNMETEFPTLKKEKLCLHKASVATWRGMVFVHPDPNAEPLAKWVEGVDAHLGPHDPEALVEYEGTASEHVIQANWKIVAENYIDIYHLSHLHSETLDMYDHERQKSGFVGPHHVMFAPLTREYAAKLHDRAPFPLIVDGPPEQIGAYGPLIFPNLGLGETESMWSVYHLVPIAPDRTRVVTRTKLAAASSWEFTRQALKSAGSWAKRLGWKASDWIGDADPLSSGDFLLEDVFACEQQQKALSSPLFSVGPTAETLEASVRGFQDLVKQMVGAA